MAYKQPINFMRYPFIYFAISLSILIPGMFSLIKFGLKPAIDFTGGSQMEFHFQDSSKVTESLLRENMAPGVEVNSIIKTSVGSYLIKTKPANKDQYELTKQNVSQNINQVDKDQFETIGPVLGKELLSKTFAALALSATLILLYVAYRFKNVKYGVCAIIAMLHDTLILLGVFSLLGHFQGVEIDTLFVTALLTILSFSVHDTIVVYDRIRESIHNFPKASFLTLINKSVNETLTRSINNSMTIIFMLLALWLMGGETTKWFVFALLVGTITGTYSSTFTAAPLLVIWDRLTKNKKK